jgi:hypothetical protein
MTTEVVIFKKKIKRVFQITPVTDNLSILLEPYVNSEFIPQNIINQVISYSFPDSEIVNIQNITSLSVSITIKLTMSNLLSVKNICRWEYNRPCDTTRCNDIARNIYSSKYVMDTMLYFNYNNINKRYEIVDGIHRYNSWKIIQQEHNKPMDLITPNEFGNINDSFWFYNSNVFINIIVNANEGTLIELFKNINKSNPISELYIRDINKDKRDLIETITKKYQSKYKTHFSACNKPNKPNVNRDRFMDMLSNIYDKHHIKHENDHMLENILENINSQIEFNISKDDLPEKIKNKCIETGLWLFNKNIDEIVQLS